MFAFFDPVQRPIQIEDYDNDENMTCSIKKKEIISIKSNEEEEINMFLAKYIFWFVDA